MFHEMPLKLYFMKYSERKVSQCILAFKQLQKNNASKESKMIKYSDILNSEHALNSMTKQLVPNVTVFFKLPHNSGHLSIADKFLKTRRCSLFRAFTVLCWLNNKKKIAS